MVCTLDQARRDFEAGVLSCVGEYRMSKAEMINWRDKDSGRAMSAPVLRHTLELNGASIQVQERVPDGTKLEDIHVPLKKGDIVVLRVSEWTVTRGLVSCRGALAKIAPVTSPGNQQPVGSDGNPKKL